MCIFFENFSCAQLHLGMEFSKRAPNQRTHQTIKHNNQMKNPIRSLALGIAFFGAASAAMAQSTLTYNATQNLTTGGASFTFNQFNSSLGTLSAIDLIINSSTLQGNATINRTSGTRTISDMIALLIVDPAAGFSGYTGTSLTYDRSPSGNIIVSSGTPTQLVTVTGTTQSLIGGSPITLSINSANFSSYTGLGNVSFDAAIFAGETQTGIGAATVAYNNLLSPTSLTLRYTYSTDPTPIPEPGQVAASLLLLGGIGAYYFVKRRRKSAPAAA
jgi:hypothetical protein